MAPIINKSTRATFGEGCQYFQLKKGGKIYRTVRVSSGPGTGHLYAEDSWGHAKQIDYDRRILPVSMTQP